MSGSRTGEWVGGKESWTDLHGLGSGSTELTRDNNLATLSTGLHDESEDSVAGSSEGKTTEELVSEGLGLGDGGESSGLDLLGVELKRVLSELESLLDEGGELPNSSSLLSEDLLGVGGPDDDLRRHARGRRGQSSGPGGQTHEQHDSALPASPSPARPLSCSILLLPYLFGFDEPSFPLPRPLSRPATPHPSRAALTMPAVVSRCPCEG